MFGRSCFSDRNRSAWQLDVQASGIGHVVAVRMVTVLALDHTEIVL